MPRVDVVAALQTLSDRELHERWVCGEPTWPDLDNAVHWLVDDTGLDLESTEAMDDSLFRTREEASLVKDAVDSLCRVIDLLGHVDAAAYVRNERWPGVVTACANALAAMAANDT